MCPIIAERLQDITSQLGSASDVKFRAQSSIDAHKDNELVGTFLSLGGK